MVTGTGAVDITGTEMVTGEFRRHAVAGRRDTGTRLRVDITGAEAGGTDKKCNKIPVQWPGFFNAITI